MHKLKMAKIMKGKIPGETVDFFCSMEGGVIACNAP